MFDHVFEYGLICSTRDLQLVTNEVTPFPRSGGVHSAGWGRRGIREYEPDGRAFRRQVMASTEYCLFSAGLIMNPG